MTCHTIIEFTTNTRFIKQDLNHQPRGLDMGVARDDSLAIEVRWAKASSKSYLVLYGFPNIRRANSWMFLSSTWKSARAHSTKISLANWSWFQQMSSIRATTCFWMSLATFSLPKAIGSAVRMASKTRFWWVISCLAVGLWLWHTPA